MTTPDTLQTYLHRWHLSDPAPLAQTFTSHIYTVTHENQRVVLKLLSDIGAADEAEGAQALMCFDGRGAVRLLQHDAGAHLLEYADGDSLVPMVQRGEDAQATAIIVEVLNQLHSVPACDHIHALKPLRRWFRSLFNQAREDQNSGQAESLFIRAAALADELLSHPQEERVLHGDIHHENIRNSARGWLAFDPKGLYGERTYDAANTLLNPISMPDLVTDEARLMRNAKILAHGLNIELQRLLQFTFAYACLSACWSMEDAQDAALALTVAEMLEPHLTG